MPIVLLLSAAAVAPDAVGVALSVVYEEKYVGIPGYKLAVSTTP